MVAVEFSWRRDSMRRKRMSVTRLAMAILMGAAALSAAPPSTLVLEIQDYATLPMTGSPTAGGNGGSLARVNFMREEPGGGRFFVVDLNGPIYILDKTKRTFTPYLNFNGRGAATGLFDKLPIEAGYANGVITMQFDPDYRRNGKFYTLHLEEPEGEGSSMPDKTSVPGLNLAGYTTTPAITTPGDTEREAVVIEWTDTNIQNTTFEGTARELMRL